MSVDELRPETNLLSAFTLMIVGAFAAGLPVAARRGFRCTMHYSGGPFAKRQHYVNVGPKPHDREKHRISNGRRNETRQLT